MQEKTLLELMGSVEQIVFRNEKNGYTVLELAAANELVTAVGSMPWVNVGEDLRLLGVWKNHPTFGAQFQVEVCERSLPKSSAAILRYLSSGAIKGVGPATANKLVEAFGEHTLEVLEKEPERLSSVPGITRAKAKKIAEEFRSVFGIRELMVYLGRYGVTPEETVRVWKLWGSHAIELIESDPYILCEETVGISFDRADGIAASLEQPQDGECRVRAGLLHVLRHNMNNGHTCLPADKLAPAAANFLGVDPGLAEDVLAAMKAEGSLVADDLGEREFVFTPRMHRSETYACARLLMILRFPPQRIVGIEREIAQIEKEQGMQYASLQKKAIESALDRGLLILTGGPGTGKTTTLNAIIRILENKGERVALAAPTGRAAQRMSEVTEREAKTIHRLLEVEWDENDHPVFTRNEKNLLDCDALILDELSMVDAQVFEGVLRALPLGCRLVLVGDTDQLPSVGPGNVLGDLIASGLMPVVQLTEIFRQSLQSLIVCNAHRIVHGEMPELNRRDSDYFFLSQYDPAAIRSIIIDLCARRLPQSYGYSPLFDIQVLCPGRKGELGTIELNRRLQEVLNPPAAGKREYSISLGVLREGDKVMQIRNNYDIPWAREDGTTGEGVFNGDVGLLLEINRPNASMTVQFDDRTALYSLENVTDLELAYAVTVHKSQGSEFQAVVMPMFPGPPQLSYRNLLYTAITRARSLLVQVGTRETVRRMVENDRKTKRFSGLYTFLTRGERYEGQ